MQTPRESGDLKPGVEFAGYRIVSVLGRGGMSVVYLAEHLGLRRKVALKLLAAQLAEDPRFRDRFVRESQVAAGIDHPNVIPIYEAGQGTGVLFIAMRYVEGTDLRALLRAEGRLDEARTVGFLRQIAAALDAAHARGLVHRDVKPANVLVARTAGSGAGEHVYLSDFGLTKRAASDAGITGTGQFVGTLDYAAPEQFEGKPLDVRTDVYSLGCLLYECLAGHAPFRRDSDAAVMYAHLLEDPPPLTEQRPGLPEEIDAVIARAMAKKPELRYQAAGELATATQDALGAAPAPGGVPPTVWSEPRRGAIIAAIAAAVVAIAAIGFAVARPTGRSSPGSGPTGPAVAAPPLDSVVQLDASNGNVLATIPGLQLQTFGSIHLSMSVGEGGVWVLDAEAATHVDPALGAVEARVPIRAAGAVGLVPVITAGLGEVWVTDYRPSAAGGQGQSGFSRIDPATNEELRSVAFPDVGPPTALALGAGSVWEAFTGGTLLRIDPRTFAVQKAFRLGGSIDALAVGNDAVWIGDGLASSLRAIDPRNEKASDPITVSGSIDGLAIAGGFVWVLDRGAGTVTPVSVASGVGTLVRVGAEPTDIIGGDSIWVSDASGLVYRVDPVTGLVTGEPFDVGAPIAALAPDPMNGAVWLLIAALAG